MMKLSTLLKDLKKNWFVTAFNVAFLHWVYHWYLMANMPTGLFGWGVTLSVSLLLFVTLMLWHYSDEIASTVGL